MFSVRNLETGDIRQYETVYLGFSIWGMTAPPVVRSFLQAHVLSGKSVRTFITHGGYGLGSSMDVVRSIALNAKVEAPFSIKADQERRTLEQVSSWLQASWGTTSRARLNRSGRKSLNAQSFSRLEVTCVTGKALP